MSRFGSACGVCAILLLASEAYAQDEPAEQTQADEELREGASEEARARFDAGTQAFDVGEYARAAEEFRAAYELTQHPDLLFNVYSALEREGGHLEEAADALEQYLQEGEVPADRRDALSARLARLRARIAEERAAEAERRLAEEQARGDRAPQGGDAAPSDGGGGIHPASIGVLIGAGVLLASFGVFAALSEVEDGRLATECGRDNPATTCSDDEVATLQAYNIVADVSWIAGAAAGVAGLIMLFALPAESDDASAEAQVAPWVAPGGAGVTAGGRF